MLRLFCKRRLFSSFAKRCDVLDNKNQIAFPKVDDEDLLGTTFETDDYDILNEEHLKQWQLDLEKKEKSNIS